jgi:hypothetical protein
VQSCGAQLLLLEGSSVCGRLLTLPRSGSLVEADLGGFEACYSSGSSREHISGGCGGVLRRPVQNQQM